MIRLCVIAALAAGFACLLCYGAMRTAERIAKHQQQQIEMFEP